MPEALQQHWPYLYTVFWEGEAKAFRCASVRDVQDVKYIMYLHASEPCGPSTDAASAFRFYAALHGVLSSRVYGPLQRQGGAERSV